MRHHATRAKYTPFPRLPKSARGGNQEPVDVAKVKDMYVKGGNFRWKDFCVAHNFNPESHATRWFAAISFESWKAEWIKQRGIETNDEVIPELVKVQKAISLQRLRYVNDWQKIAGNMKALLSHLMNQHVMDAAEDQQNALAIRSGQKQKRCKLSAEDLTTFSSAAQRVQELERRALLISLEGTTMAKIEEQQDEIDDGVPEIEINTMGAQGMTPEQTIGMMATYFDQFEHKPVALPEPEKPDEKEAQV